MLCEVLRWALLYYKSLTGFCLACVVALTRDVNKMVPSESAPGPTKRRARRRDDQVVAESAMGQIQRFSRHTLPIVGRWPICRIWTGAGWHYDGLRARSVISPRRLRGLCLGIRFSVSNVWRSP